MDAELERIVSADEEARARLEAARAEAQRAVEAARRAQEQMRLRQRAEATRSLDEEVRRILTDADGVAMERQQRREEWLAAREAASAPLLVRAAETYARIVRGEEEP